jgi:trypsin
MDLRMYRLPILAALFALVPAAPAGAVVNGANAADGDWPWQVQLLIGPSMCGGSLVAPDRVVTAAHCTVGFNGGDITVYSGSRTSWAGVQTAVAEVGEHPSAQVSDPSLPPRSDVSILKLTGNVSAGQAVDVVGTTLADNALWDTADDELWVTGFGLTTPGPLGGDIADTLQEALVPRVSDAGCGAPATAGGWGVDFSASDMVCAIDLVNDKDACNGDSGGPLVARASTDPASQADPADWKLVGVVSWGSPYCGGIGDPNPAPDPPGVYARLGASSLNAFAQPTAAVTWKPQATGSPQLTGTAAVGSTLTCQPATWEPTPSTTERQFWSFASPDDVEPQFRAIGGQYTVTSSDAGRLIACLELAENAGGLGYATSTFSDRVPTPEAPAPSPAPQVIAPPPGQPAVLPLPPTSASTQPDTTAPTSRYAGRSCRARRCTIAVVVNDDRTSPLLLRAKLVRLVRSRCRRGGRVRRCTRQRPVNVTVERIAATLFEVRTPQLVRRGRYRLRAWASDSARNEQARPLVVTFTA